jgi:hypothetical protein
MANEIIFILKWRLSDIIESYPHLTLMQAQQVLNDLDTRKDWLIQEGWNVIGDIVDDILGENI